ncbi:hypothetical protein [Gorillibacterium massiliense]|uniref:hypothetical protein n=1 Tax=Gorillibacterium massiliense TaxID=1280390 RepID=UPI0004BA4B2E|nr:hypothetical protein [Gorillibacterium massiliense]
MLMLIMLIAVAAAFWEYKSLRAEKRKREIAVSACFLAIGVMFGTISLIKKELPSPMRALEHLLQPASDFLTSMLS